VNIGAQMISSCSIDCWLTLLGLGSRSLSATFGVNIIEVIGAEPLLLSFLQESLTEKLQNTASQLRQSEETTVAKFKKKDDAEEASFESTEKKLLGDLHAAFAPDDSALVQTGEAGLRKVTQRLRDLRACRGRVD